MFTERNAIRSDFDLRLCICEIPSLWESIRFRRCSFNRVFLSEVTVAGGVLVEAEVTVNAIKVDSEVRGGEAMLTVNDPHTDKS